jgi:archaetidylinositol phosphate synthase
MLAENRGKFKKIEIIVGKLFSKIGLTPNQFSLLSIFFATTSFYFLVNKNLILTLPFFVLAVFLDFVDGAVARFLNKETKRGAYLDTICDRYVEGITLLGFLFLPLPDFILSPKIWIFLAFFGSLMTTYSKAAAKEKELIEKELKKGLFGRAERVILILMAVMFGIFNFSWFLYPIIVLAILSNITALQRVFLVLGPGKS